MTDHLLEAVFSRMADRAKPKQSPEDLRLARIEEVLKPYRESRVGKSLIVCGEHAEHNWRCKKCKSVRNREWARLKASGVTRRS